MDAMSKIIDHVSDASLPWVTYYDESTGERTELSARTAQNWVDKTSNFLIDDLAAEPGIRAAIHLPTHWQSLVWLLACWNVGATVCSSSGEIGVYGPAAVSNDDQAGNASDEAQRVALSLKPLGLAFDEPPVGFIDYNAEVRAHPDDFVSLDEPSDSTPAIDLDGTHVGYSRLLDAPPLSRRILVTPATLSQDVWTLRRLLAGGGSLVIVASADTERCQQIGQTERAELQISHRDRPNTAPGSTDPLDSSRSD